MLSSPQSVAVCGFSIWLSLAASSLAQQAAPANQPPTPATEGALTVDDMRALLRQLGADSFEARELATRRLEGLGLAAKAVLQEGMSDRDVEVRTRARRLWQTVQSQDFENRLKAFVADIEGKLEHRLPGWSRFREVIGGDKLARELFVDMQRHEPGLLSASDSSPKAAAEMFAIACRDYQQSMFGIHGQRQDIPVGSIASLIFVGSDPKISVNDQSAMLVYQFMHQPAMQSALQGSGGQVDVLRKLLGAWVGRSLGVNARYQNLMLAMQYNLKEGLHPALEMIKSTAVHASQKAYAIVAVGKLGSKDHLPEVEKLLSDSTVCAAFRVNDQQISTETRDVALAVLVHLTGQNLKEYGFDRAQSNPQMLFFPYTLGFTEPARRDAAMKKWKDWKDRQKT
jgi:hypothetical protein